MRKIPEYLQRHASELIQSEPFNQWPFEKLLEDDMEPSIISYIFEKNGMTINCDSDEIISAIFLYSDDYGGFDCELFGVPFFWGRRKVCDHFGKPSRSGGKSRSEYLGESGPWDRFAMPGYVMHVEYKLEVDEIRLITLMTEQAAP
jgi:hypothetical protein